MAIITTQELGEYLGIDPTGNAKISSIVSAVNAWVVNYTSRHFGEDITITEKHDYAPVVFLNEADIKSITSVKVNGETIDLSDLKIDKTTGRILIYPYGEAKYGRNYFDAIEVVYVVGGGVPADLKLATLQLASDNYNRNDSGEGNIASESVGGYSKSYGGAVMASGSNITASNPADYMNIFNYYKRVHL